MHLIIGALLAAYLKKKKDPGGGVSLPRLRTGPLSVVHSMPGRVRYRVPSLKENDVGRAALLDKLAAADGIETVRVNRVNGSLLVLFVPAKVDEGIVTAAVAKLLGLESEIDRPPDPALVRELRDFGAGVNRAVYEKTGGLVDAWSAAYVALAIVGVRRLLRGGSPVFPAGFTLVWWALHGLAGGRNHRWV